MSLAGASVALIILVDIATGQGPPQLNSYLGRIPSPDYRQAGPLPVMGYIPPGSPLALGDGYESKKGDYKEGEKGSLKGSELKLGHKEVYPGKKELEKDYEKYGKEYEKFGKEYEKYGKEYGKYGSSTPAPGVMSSISESMSGAWKSLTSLGRHKRHGINFGQGGRGFPEEIEWRQYNNQGYMFFKVPRNLVCH